MKVRMLGNSIRYRLKQPEVSSFERLGKVIEVVEFGQEPSDQLRFVLETYTGETISVGFQANTTTICVPQSTARQWIHTEMVGFEGQVDTGKGKTIQVLVEKDFMCIDGNEADNEGAFPNPLAIC